MLVWVHRLMGSWVARIFFSLLILGFVFWGVSNVLSIVGSDTAVARVGGTSIDVASVQAAYQAALGRASQHGQPDLATRQQLAAQALANAVRKQVMLTEEKSLGITVPNAAIRQVLDAEPAFQTNGVFDKAKFKAVLAQNNTSPDQYISQLRAQIAERQLLYPLLAGIAPSDILVNKLFTYIGEERFAQLVKVPVAAQTAPSPPSEAVLRRYWQNHPADFTAPEYRKVKIVILSPALLAPHEQIAPAAIAAGVARMAANETRVAQRSVQVISVGDLASSSRLEAAWKHGADWAKMQGMAKKYGATSVDLDKAAQSQIPSTNLAKAVFAAPVGKVMGPVAGKNGMYVFKVTGADETGLDRAAITARVTQQLQLRKAQADVAKDVDALQDALAGQTPLDQLPANLGLTAVQGTLDANGNTPEGKPAPIPGNAALKTAIVKAAFAAQQGEPAQLVNGPNDSYFALTVDKVEPPALQAFAQVRAKVLADWTKKAMTREAEVKAADLFHAVQQGQKLTAAAGAAGLPVSTSPALTRDAAPGTDRKLAAILFTLKPGKASMLQTGGGFTVAVLKKIIDPNPSQDPADAQQVRQEATKALQDDIGQSFLAGLQSRDHVSVNQKMFAQIYQ